MYFHALRLSQNGQRSKFNTCCGCIVRDPSTDDWRAIIPQWLQAVFRACPTLGVMLSHLFFTPFGAFTDWHMASGFNERGISLSCLSGGGVLL
jgi:hypothetical protein